MGKLVEFSSKQLKNQLFNEAHRLITLEEEDYVLVKAINKSEWKRKILKNILQVYEGPYQIKKQVRPGTVILWNP